ncbi:MAG TPA: hypothetical protein VN436_11340, partial [Holophaga sp.]|nr:hypothetical protein [Holophaga sp.]
MSFLLAITDFSTGEGVYTAEQLARLVPRLGYADLAIWDRGLHGYPKLREELAYVQAPVRLHVGCRFSWRGEDFGALPFSDAGYAALNHLLTIQAHGSDGDFGQPEPPRNCVLLAERLAGLELLLREGLEASLLAHPRRHGEAAEALRRGLPVMAPQVLRFRTPAGLELHRLKRAIATQDTVLRTEPLWHLQDAAVDRRTWEARFPWAEPRIARATEAALTRIAGWPIHWGAWVNAGPLGLEGSDLDAELRERVRRGILKRYGAMDGEREHRMEHELDLIRRKGFTAYFLLVKDLVSHSAVARTCGRGSGAASLVSYALELTNVDPIDTNLVFERFLTEARKDPPDLDIDFAWDERDGVLQSVFERYGRARVAMVANHCCFKPKGALRAVAQAHGRPEAELKALAKYVRGWDGGLEKALENPHWAPLLVQAEALGAVS